MYTQYIFTLRTIIALPLHLQKQVLEKVDDEFIKFLVECIVNLVHGNFRAAKKEQFKSHTEVLEFISSKHTSISRKQQRVILASTKGRKLLKVISPLIFDKFGKK